MMRAPLACSMTSTVYSFPYALTLYVAIVFPISATAGAAPTGCAPTATMRSVRGECARERASADGQRRPRGRRAAGRACRRDRRLRAERCEIHRPPKLLLLEGNVATFHPESAVSPAGPTCCA